jgi:hypothetical protein
MTSPRFEYFPTPCIRDDMDDLLVHIKALYLRYRQTEPHPTSKNGVRMQVLASSYNHIAWTLGYVSLEERLANEKHQRTETQKVEQTEEETREKGGSSNR